VIDSVSEFAGRGSEESGFDLAMWAGEVNLRVESRRHSENEAKGEREYMFHRRFTALSALRLSMMGGAGLPRVGRRRAAVLLGGQEGERSCDMFLPVTSGEALTLC
jgi:hypothetical protein